MLFIFVHFFLKRGGGSNKLLSLRTKFFRSWHSRLTITTWLIFFGLFAFLANLPMAQEAFSQEVVNCFPGSGTPAFEVITISVAIMVLTAQNLLIVFGLKNIPADRVAR